MVNFSCSFGSEWLLPYISFIIPYKNGAGKNPNKLHTIINNEFDVPMRSLGIDDITIPFKVGTIAPPKNNTNHKNNVNIYKSEVKVAGIVNAPLSIENIKQIKIEWRVS